METNYDTPRDERALTVAQWMKNVGVLKDGLSDDELLWLHKALEIEFLKIEVGHVIKTHTENMRWFGFGVFLSAIVFVVFLFLNVR